MTPAKKPSPNSQIIIYQSDDGKIKIDVKIEDETAWLSQKSMAQLFDCSVDNVALHLKNTYETAELSEKTTSEDFSVVQKEGNREVSRNIKHYNLDAIISVGYRVNSLRGTQFRMWATQRLKEYIVKGFSLNETKLKTGKPTKYFDLLQEKLEQAIIELFSEVEIPHCHGETIHKEMSDVLLKCRD